MSNCKTPIGFDVTKYSFWHIELNINQRCIYFHWIVVDVYLYRLIFVLFLNVQLLIGTVVNARYIWTSHWSIVIVKIGKRIYWFTSVKMESDLKRWTHIFYAASFKPIINQSFIISCVRSTQSVSISPICIDVN